jgi:hypothetical protein
MQPRGLLSMLLTMPSNGCASTSRLIGVTRQLSLLRRTGLTLALRAHYLNCVHGAYLMLRNKATAYATFAASVVRSAKAVDDLELWWREEADHREAYSVFKDSPEWNTLIKACGDRKAQILRETRAAF